MSLDLTTPGGVLLALLPEIVLTGFALVVLLVIAWRHRTVEDSRLAGWLSLAGLVVSGGALGFLWLHGARPAGAVHMVALDGFRYAALGLILLSTAATVLLSLTYLERERLLAPEYYCLLLLAASGMMFLASAQDMVVLFLGLEVMSISVYVLAGFDRTNRYSSEAALKYFLLGAFASGFLLYGIALLYGATGTMNLPAMAGVIARGQLGLMGALGTGLLLVGLAFKVAAVPFHMWTPDVYDGSPTPVTGFMATGVKVAAFVALARVLVGALGTSTEVWRPVVFVLAILSMAVGNLVALAQPSLKRMLAYSSIAHAGYLLVALWPGTRLGTSAALLYLLAYTLTTLAAFGLLSALGRDGERGVTVDSIAGLGHQRPWIALSITICMLSLLGFPGTFGFIGKWTILTAVVGEGNYVLPVVLVLTSLLSAGYYLPVVMSMYMRPALSEDAHGDVWLSAPGAAVVAFTIALVLVFGFWPTPALNTALEGARSLFEGTVPLAGSLGR